MQLESAKRSLVSIVVVLAPVLSVESPAGTTLAANTIGSGEQGATESWVLGHGWASRFGSRSSEWRTFGGLRVGAA